MSKGCWIVFVASIIAYIGFRYLAKDVWGGLFFVGLIYLSMYLATICDKNDSDS